MISNANRFSKSIGEKLIKESGRRSIDFCDMTILYLNDDMLQY